MYIYSAVTQRWHGEEFAHAELNLATRRVPFGGPLVENFKNFRTLIAPQNPCRTPTEPLSHVLWLIDLANKYNRLKHTQPTELNLKIRGVKRNNFCKILGMY